MTSTQSTSPVLTYDFPGIYTISLTITDSNGVVDKYMRPFEVKAPQVTDMSNDTNPVNFPLTVGQPSYFLVSLLPLPRSMMQITDPNSPFPRLSSWQDMTYSVTPGKASDTASLTVRYSSINMANPDCTSVTAQLNPASCTLPIPGGGDFYAMVQSTKPVDSVILRWRATLSDGSFAGSSY